MSRCRGLGFRFLLPAVLFSASAKTVTTITHEPLHLAWWNFARTCTLTTSRTVLNIKVIGQRSHGFFVCFVRVWYYVNHLDGIHEMSFATSLLPAEVTGATRGQYLALSKAWQSCLWTCTSRCKFPICCTACCATNPQFVEVSGVRTLFERPVLPDHPGYGGCQKWIGEKIMLPASPASVGQRRKTACRFRYVKCVVYVPKCFSMRSLVLQFAWAGWLSLQSLDGITMSVCWDYRGIVDWDQDRVDRANKYNGAHAPHFLAFLVFSPHKVFIKAALVICCLFKQAHRSMH